ncbi:MAG: universal stress protein [Anaerolineales bacterium]|nr:universal stress protein [Anaerolineales bacterium]
MSKRSSVSYQLALRDFEDARRQAVMQQMLARIRGEESKLLHFHEVRQMLRDTGETIPRGLQEIPLHKIVGSVDRYEDFTRSFLPKRAANAERWAGVRAAVNDMVGMPPIEVYQLGDAYFVLDGNHRVSIARRLGSKTISARVTEVKTRVPLTADDDPNEIICKSYYADFLAETNLDQLRPGADLRMTFCDQYPLLRDQIQAEQAFLNRERAAGGEPATWEEAVCAWYDRVYLPVVQLIRELGVMRRFPERTETDLYVLLSKREAELEKELGWQVEKETAVSTLLAPLEEPPNLLNRVVRSVAPAFDAGPPPGLWRQQQLARKRYHHLFEHILVPLDGSEAGWQMFEYIVQAAMYDQDHLLGLHVVPDEAALRSPAVRQMRERFDHTCQNAGLQGEFAVEVSQNVVDVIVRRAAWADFVIVNTTQPPAGQPLPQISPELKRLIQQCPRPIQVRPEGTQSDNSRALLAYDGSPKADEALFIATYLTARWKKSLTIVTVETDYTTAPILERAREYVARHGLFQVNYVLGHGPIAEVVLETAVARACNVLFIGGFSFRPIRHLTLGSTAERILREFRDPVWICQ